MSDRNDQIINNSDESRSLNFIEQIIEDDNSTGKHKGLVYTRFPPEPNGYLHIGHAKSICLNFGLAIKYDGKCNLRFDDTNPTKEDVEYVESIKEDIKWLGFTWEGEPRYASDYFGQLYEWAEKLIVQGDAYICDLSADEVSATRGTPTIPGKESPYRNRTVEENLDLFRRMKAGEFQEGERVLRAKIDMSSPNMNMRDPVLYRISYTPHHNTGTQWCIYPMYDFAHGQSDYIEGITHSICTLEFEIHRPLYDWFLDKIIDTEYRPRQIEFARFNLSYTVMSKRVLRELVEKNIVSGWDDPRMPTICGLRRRGYTPESLRNFTDRIGVAKRENMIDVALLEFLVREDLNKRAPRVMAVIDPLKVVITNYPEHEVEELPAENNPEDESMGTRILPFSRELYIERDDFMENPPKNYFRLSPNGEVRLKSAYIIKCENVVKDSNGQITEIHCTYDAETKSGLSSSNKKVKGTLHWVSAQQSLEIEVRLYDRLFTDTDPSGHKDVDYKTFLNPDSLKIIEKCYIEPSVRDAKVLDCFQFQRIGYFCVDKDSTPEKLVFNRTVPLRDNWGKMKEA